ncbi:hypothetical protein TRVA0_037S00562 [Trichomonascus vanleenenianus]|uniref:uncharacterized protein n=1 Tax=Trichomonascus vanleenenianus TaxID=2268995 RepID=UPI003EC99E7B
MLLRRCRALGTTAAAFGPLKWRRGHHFTGDLARSTSTTSTTTSRGRTDDNDSSHSTGQSSAALLNQNPSTQSLLHPSDQSISSSSIQQNADSLDEVSRDQSQSKGLGDSLGEDSLDQSQLKTPGDSLNKNPPDESQLTPPEDSAEDGTPGSKQIIGSRQIMNITDQMISLLDRITPDEERQKLSTIVTENMLYRYYHLPGTKLPEPPRNGWTIGNLTEYVHLLTQKLYIEGPGAVDTTLNDIFNDNSTYDYHTTEAYNMAIAFFLRTRNLKQARRLYEQMCLHSKAAPSRETFHLLLLSSRHRYNPGYTWYQHPAKFALEVVRSMVDRNITANSETWSIVMQAIPRLEPKLHFLSEMQSRRVPLTIRGGAEVTQDMIELLGPDRAMDQLTKTPKGFVTIECLNLVMHNLAMNKHRNRAWRYLTYGLERFGLHPTTTTMNMLLETFVSKLRLDWMFGVMAFLGSEYGCRPNGRTYMLLFEAAVKQKRFHENKFAVLELILARMHRDGCFHHRMKYLLHVAQCQRRFYADVVKVLPTQSPDFASVAYTSTHEAEWQRLLQGLKWPRHTARLVYKPGSVADSCASYLLGFTASKLAPHNTHAAHQFYKARHKQQWMDFKASLPLA